MQKGSEGNQKRMKILIIIPAYNEELNIERVVHNLTVNYPQYDYVVVNDGSKDSTAEICRENGYNMIDLPINLGLTGAVQAGMRYAVKMNYDAAVQFDADGQHRPEYIEKLIRELETANAQIVIGSRYISGKRKLTFRMAGSEILTFVIKLFTGVKITDPTSGMRIFGKDILKKFAFDMNCGPEPDTISYLIKQGIPVREISVKMDERTAGESYLNIMRSLEYMIQMCFSIIFVQGLRKEKDK